MSRKQKKPQAPVGLSRHEIAAKAERAIAWARVFERIVDKCGLTGAFLFFACGFVVVYASAEQKRAIIDLFILGHGIKELYPTLLASLVFLALLMGQQYYYGKRIRRMDKELARLGEWKSNHQQSLISSPLHHSEEAGE
jgi:hypothetical protein